MTKESSSRRDFLKLASVSAPALAAAAVAGRPAEAEVPDPASDRIQDTEHTRAYYDSARF